MGNGRVSGRGMIALGYWTDRTIIIRYNCNTVVFHEFLGG